MVNALTVERIKQKIRSIPDFPQPGVIFRHVGPLLEDAELFQSAVEALSFPWRTAVHKVAAIEARGFVLGASVALHSNSGLVMLRKPGKLPPPVLKERYELEYGSSSLELAEGTFSRGERVILVDDVLATGGTARAAINLLRAAGADVHMACFLIDLPHLGGHQLLRSMDVQVHNIVSY